MAEMYFNYKAKSQNLIYKARSAGIFAYNDLPISDYAKKVLEFYKIPVSDNFKSQRITLEDIIKSQFIFTMEQYQCEYLRENYKEHYNKIYNLASFLGRTEDINDPAGGSLQSYFKIFDKIKFYIDLLINFFISKQVLNGD